jgi:hypothetical protein
MGKMVAEVADHSYLGQLAEMARIELMPRMEEMDVCILHPQLPRYSLLRVGLKEMGNHTWI